MHRCGCRRRTGATTTVWWLSTSPPTHSTTVCTCMRTARMPCWRSRAAFRSVSHLTAGGDHAGPPLEAPDSCAREREWTRWTHRGGGKARSTACLPFTLVPNGWVSQTMMTALWKPREDGRRVRNPTLVLNLQFNGTSDDAALAISQAATLNPTLQVPTRIRCPRDVWGCRDWPLPSSRHVACKEPKCRARAHCRSAACEDSVAGYPVGPYSCEQTIPYIRP